MTQQAPSYPSPPSSRAASPSPAERDGDGHCGAGSSSAEGDIPLSARLDALLESYLELLDTYTTLRAQLSNEFSSGFLALAQANRTSSLGPGRRYGEEGFDERMKAFKAVQISSKDKLHGVAQKDAGSQRGPSTQLMDQDEDKGQQKEKHKHKHNLRPASVATPIENKHKIQKREFHGLPHQTGPASSLTRLTSHHPVSTFAPASTSASGSTASRGSSYGYTITSSPYATTDATEDRSLPKCHKSQDPLKWYGILTPPYLRQCQARFTSSVTSTIPNLLSTVSSLAALEEDIWSLRRELGIRDEYDA